MPGEILPAKLDSLRNKPRVETTSMLFHHNACVTSHIQLISHSLIIVNSTISHSYLQRMVLKRKQIDSSVFINNHSGRSPYFGSFCSIFKGSVRYMRMCSLRRQIQIDLEIRERQNIDTNIIELRIYNQK